MSTTTLQQGPVSRRHAATFHSQHPGGPLLVLAHGFGCDQGMWDLVVPRLAPHVTTLTFDHVGAGRSDLEAYDAARYSTLDGYAEDLVELLDELDASEVVVVGHSVSAMIAALAYRLRPERIKALVMVGPSPRYVNDGDYTGGFSEQEVLSLLETLQANYLGWSAAMAPVIMGTGNPPDLAARLERSFCSTDPTIAEQFARVTFLSDHRDALPHVEVPTLVLQCTDDIIAPVSVGRYVADQLPRSTYQQLEAIGHCPHVSAPEETAQAVLSFVSSLR